MKSQLDPNLLDPGLARKIREYYRYDQLEKSAKGRRTELGKQIKGALFNLLPERHPGQVYSTAISGVGVTLQLKSGRAKIEDGVLEQLLLEKGLLDQALRPQLDHDLVEQLFLEGKLTDDDLRSIHGGADITLALSVEAEKR